MYLSFERRAFVKTKVDTLLAIGHIRIAMYPKWLSNVVQALKPPSWRMCVDYTDLNKVCCQDPFSLPWTNQLEDETANCELFSLMDAFMGYNQIFREGEDKERTMFVTSDIVFCFRVMVIELINSSAMFTWMVPKIFKDLLGEIMGYIWIKCW